MYASEMLEGHWGQEQVCKCFLYMSLILTMGRKSVAVCAVFVFGSTWNIVLFQDDGIFLFFSAPFSRRRSLVDDCFTGQSPGSAISIPAAPDVHEALGQIQASAP